jgi:hypothetical protein
MFMVGRINIEERAKQPNIVYRLHAIYIKVPMSLFKKIESSIQELYENTKIPKQIKQS